MALTVATQDLQDRTGVITVQGASQEEVMSPAAKQLAINTAVAGGITRAGVSGNEVAYPIDAEGNTSDDLVLGRMGPDAVQGYRCDYNLTGGL